MESVVKGCSGDGVSCRDSLVMESAVGNLW